MVVSCLKFTIVLLFPVVIKQESAVDESLWDALYSLHSSFSNICLPRKNTQVLSLEWGWWKN